MASASPSRAFASSASAPLPLSPLTAVSSLDGRYSSQTSPLRPFFSEYGLIRNRVKVQVNWVLFLSREAEIKELKPFSPRAEALLLSLVDNFTVEEAQKVKEIEKTTKHDLKAVEYYLKDCFEKDEELKQINEFLHFCCTSEDVNNLSYALLLKEALEEEVLPVFSSVVKTLEQLSHRFAAVPLLSRTHGQTATPTTVGKELSNFVFRLERQRKQLRSVEIMGKLNGAVGNYNAHLVAYPQLDWQSKSRQFVSSFGLSFSEYSTQIEFHDYLAELAHCFSRVNTIMIDLNRDLWGYISLGYFRPKSAKGEVGSSTMPHKINPIDFENSEGNCGLSNALFGHFAEKLPISRFQRDLTDSTVLRGLGSAFGHFLLAQKSCLAGLNKLEIQEDQLHRDLEEAWEVLAEPIQTVMRKHQVDKPYEKLKELTRGKRISKEDIRGFIERLDGIPQDEKDKLLALTPHNYLGIAEKLAKDIKMEDN